VTSEDVPMPYAKTLEKAYLPQPEKIIDAVHRVMYR
jgi:pyruvate/2-oxoglutarate/acetoin dehydrogenase E1 component